MHKLTYVIPINILAENRNNGASASDAIIGYASHQDYDKLVKYISE